MEPRKETDVEKQAGEKSVLLPTEVSEDIARGAFRTSLVNRGDLIVSQSSCQSVRTSYLKALRAKGRPTKVRDGEVFLQVLFR